jgi:hypothetical protein
MKIFYNDSIKHGKNSTLEIKLECSYIVSGKGDGARSPFLIKGANVAF